ncbi:methyltransferase [Actinomadura graeca]|uniref:Methyltransferase n=1 Tax=Actinomadura graeca TaxID=2750812 RepID=A0ABX8QSV2_9ACTN|nr:acetylserotonin O-methyltransferase [Actinomadura graeca]QXJ21838.1 methyltransferase [Actinomadura graeca]
MTGPGSRPLFGVLTGTWLSQAGYVAAELGVADHLSDEPRPIDEVAPLVGADPDALYRVMRALAAVGVFEETGPRRFALNDEGRMLRSDSPASFKHFILLNGLEHIRLFGELLDNVRTGRPASDKVYGKHLYDYLGEHPELQDHFFAAHGRTAPRVAMRALSEIDLSDARTIVDLGGGDGGLLEHVLKDHPHLHGTLFDLPTTVPYARERLTAAGLADRCDLVGGSFFEEIPEGADVYVIAHCLHNWNDEKAAEILRNIRRAVPGHGRLLVLEHLVAGEGFHLSKLIDLLMMVVDGRERSEAELSGLLEKSGFELRGVRSVAFPGLPSDSVLEAVPA